MKHSDTAALCCLPHQRGKDKKFYFLYSASSSVSAVLQVADAQYNFSLLLTWYRENTHFDLQKYTRSFLWGDTFLLGEEGKGLLSNRYVGGNGKKEDIFSIRIIFKFYVTSVF